MRYEAVPARISLFLIRPILLDLARDVNRNVAYNQGLIPIKRRPHGTFDADMIVARLGTHVLIEQLEFDEAKLDAALRHGPELWTVPNTVPNNGST
jgi:hypothetical protein